MHRNSAVTLLELGGTLEVRLLPRSERLPEARHTDVLRQVMLLTGDCGTIIFSLERRAGVLVGTHCVVDETEAEQVRRRLPDAAHYWANAAALAS